jgi:hypothetical protein
MSQPFFLLVLFFFTSSPPPPPFFNASGTLAGCSAAAAAVVERGAPLLGSVLLDGRSDWWRREPGADFLEVEEEEPNEFLKRLPAEILPRRPASGVERTDWDWP